MQEDGEPSISASSVMPSFTTCHYSPSRVPCGTPQGQQVSSFISKKCRYLSVLGSPNYCQLPARVAELLLTLTTESKHSFAELEETN